MSWLRGGAQEWNNQFRDTWNRAANSVQRFAEQAELQHLGEQFLAQAQTLAEQGEAALSNVADKVTGGVSSLGLTSEGLTNGSREELVHRFVREAKQLEPPGAIRLLVADVAQVLRAWQARLKRPERADSDTPGRAAGRASEALQALLQSQALHIALTALTRSRAGRAVLRAAAEAEAEGSLGSHGSRPMLEGEAGVCLKEILACACAVPAPLVKQLLMLLSDAADEKSQAKRPGAEAVMDSATQDLQWILALLSASLLHAEEVAADDAGELRRSLDVVGSASAASAELPPLNSEVWASWPGDGRWFRAKVVGHAGSRVDIAWLRRGSEGVGKEDEYLCFTGSDELQFTRLTATAVTLAANRPERAGEGKVPRWLEQLGRAEECSRHFRNLRKVCNQLSQSSTPRRDPLEGMAQQLAAMRMESEARMTALSSAAEARATAGGGLNQQLASSSEGFQAEIASMQQEQQALEARLKELRKQREDLANQLKVVDEQIDVALAAQLASAERERQVKASAQRVAGELQRELSIEEVEARKVGDRQRLLLEAGAASRDIEELLATRAEATAARFAAHDYLAEQQPKAAEMCLQSEKERGRALEELLAGWHTEVWGPEAKELAKDTQMVMKLKSLHARAAAVLHQAWKETVQLAAESLGDGSALGEASQDISRAAERYKELQKEVKSNVDRMASWVEAEEGERSERGERTSQPAASSQVSTQEGPEAPVAPAQQPEPVQLSSGVAEVTSAQGVDEGLEDAE
ncbi:unnamed protein product [Symbiodinium sp. CCMP2592]|nr:unnamed protein product [Symbiodinium sp. CCMP2592]